MKDEIIAHAELILKLFNLLNIDIHDVYNTRDRAIRTNMKLIYEKRVGKILGGQATFKIVFDERIKDASKN